ncbi:hypothetical protein J6590_023086 [Homalodisca vitripennis]|nr:hypothetical protein J6590_023086 [Homalodisca vitripennis]
MTRIVMPSLPSVQGTSEMSHVKLSDVPSIGVLKGQKEGESPLDHKIDLPLFCLLFEFLGN